MEIKTANSPCVSRDISWSEGRDLTIDKPFTEDGHIIASQTTLAFSSKILPSQTDLLFELLKKSPVWGFFSIPQGFYDSSNRFFTRNLLPWLDTDCLLTRFKTMALKHNLDLTKPSSSTVIYKLLQTLDELKKISEEALSHITRLKKG